MTPLLQKLLPLAASTSSPLSHLDPKLQAERMKDHYSHFILRLAFSGTDDLRRRFTRIESSLFRLRFLSDDARERQSFIEGADLQWEAVGEEEKRALAGVLGVGVGMGKREVEEGSWFKVEWGVVPELVEGRRVLVRKGWAYVPGREQMSLVVGEFGRRLERGLEVGYTAVFCYPYLLFTAPYRFVYIGLTWLAFVILLVHPFGSCGAHGSCGSSVLSVSLSPRLSTHLSASLTTHS